MSIVDMYAVITELTEQKMMLERQSSLFADNRHCCSKARLDQFKTKCYLWHILKV